MMSPSQSRRPKTCSAKGEQKLQRGKRVLRKLRQEIHQECEANLDHMVSSSSRHVWASSMRFCLKKEEEEEDKEEGEAEPTWLWKKSILPSAG